MRFFTDEKYRNGSAFTDYETYCKSIWSSVPLGLRRICNGMLPPEFDSSMVFGLHDGRIAKYEDDKQANEIRIYYTIFDDENNEQRLKATYKDSKCVKQPSDIFVGDDRDCDIMCHEISCSENSLLSHALLFASSEELIIEFSAFELEIEDIR